MAYLLRRLAAPVCGGQDGASSRERGTSNWPELQSQKRVLDPAIAMSIVVQEPASRLSEWAGPSLRAHRLDPNRPQSRSRGPREDRSGYRGRLAQQECDKKLKTQ